MLIEKKLIFVDDDPVNLTNFQQLFTGEDSVIKCAKNRNELMNILEEITPDLILLDIMLGDENGINILLEIKRNPATRDLFVILISGVFSPTDQEELAYSLGADGMIKRPLSNKELLTQVRSYLRYKEAVYSFRKTHKQLQSVIDQNPDSIFIIDNNGIIKYVNPSAADFVGSTPQKLLNTPVPFPYAHLTHSAITVITPDNSKVYGEAKYIPVEWEDKPGTLIIIHDITERKKLQDKLKQSDRLFNNAVDMLCIAGLDGFFKAVNPSFTRVLGYSEEELLSRPWNSFIYPEDIEATNQVVEEINQGINLQSFTNRYVCKDGSIKWLSWNTHTYPDDQSIFAVARDVTEMHMAHIALRESEETFKRIFYDHFACQFIFDPDTLKIASFNQAALNFYGYTAEQFTLLSLENIDTKPTSQLKELTRKVTSESPMQFLLQHKLADGRIKDVDVYACRININNKALIHIIVHDISKEIQAKRQLHLFSRAIEQNTASILITDAQGSLIYINPAFTELTGYTSDEVLGLTPGILNSGKNSPDLYKRLWETITKGQVFEEELINRKKNGELFWAKETISPLLNTDGVINHFVSITEDITQTKTMKENLRVSEHKFRNVWESASEGMRLMNRDGIIIEVNPAFANQFGLTQEDVQGKSFTEFVQDGDSGQWTKFLKELKDGTLPHHIDRKITLKDGKEKWFSVSNSFIPDTDDDTLLLSIFSDITQTRQLILELTEARDKAEEVNKIKSYFFANMSHELQTPFVGIMGYAEMLTEMSDDPNIVRAAQFIVKSSNRLAQTLSKILTLSKLEFEKPELHFTDVNVSEVLRETCLVYQDLANKKNIGLLFSNIPDGVIIKTEGKFFREIADNLISNAVKFTDSGRVEVACLTGKPGSKFLTISVKDTGIGIPYEKQDLIWQEFRQVSEGLSRAYEGTGLGLSLTRKFVSLLGGTISLESTPGFGSEFKVHLPVKSFKSKAAEPVKLSEPVNAEIVGKRILYVEDDPAAMELIQLIFKNKHILEATDNPEAAIQMVKSNHFDVLMIDINLGLKTNGLELVRIINEIPGYKNIPKIAVTAYANIEQKDEFLAGGFTHYISKPFFRNEILAIVQKALSEYSE